MSAQLQPAAGEKPSWLFLTKPIYGLGLVHPANMTRPLSAVIVMLGSTSAGSTCFLLHNRTGGRHG